MTFLTNLKFEPKGTHSSANTYNVTDVVTSADGSTAYAAVKNVPAGVVLGNTAYWVKILNLSDVRASAIAAADDAYAAAGAGIRTDTAQNLNAVQKDTAHENIGLKDIVYGLTDAFTVSGNPAQCNPVGGLAFERVETQFLPVQAGSGEPSTDNIRSIGGYEGMRLMLCNRNLFDDTTFAGGLISSATGAASVDDSRAYSNYLLLEAGTYTVSTIGNVYPGRAHFYSEAAAASWTGSYLLSDKLSVSGGCRSAEFTLESACYVRILFVPDGYDGTQSAVSMLRASNPLLHLRTEPYAVDFGQKVYGGSMNWTTGELTITHAYVEYGGDAAFNSGNTLVYEHGERIRVTASLAKAAEDDVNLEEVFCNQIKPDWKNGGWSSGARNNVYIPAGSPRTLAMILPTDIFGTTEDSVRTAFANNPLQVAYKLKTPETLQLSPQVIAALQGKNILYGGGSSIVVSGRQPQGIALEKRIAALEAAVLNA